MDLGMQVKRMGISGYREQIFKHSKYVTHYCRSRVRHTSLILNNGVTGTTQKVLLGTGAPITTSDRPQCSWYVVMPAYCIIIFAVNPIVRTMRVCAPSF